MRWEEGQRSADIEDRRGQPSAGGGGGGLLKLGVPGMVLGLILSVVFGRNMFTGGGTRTTKPYVPTAEEEKLVKFVSFVLDDIQSTWDRTLPQLGGRPYEHAKLVLFNGSVDSACGSADAAVGPFYCPGDQKLYIDLGFYKDLDARFGAPGDFAQAYVLAHEIGHHLQNLLGIEQRIRRMQKADPSSENRLSVRMELQADCFAGVWAHSTAQRNILEAGDVEEGLGAAAAVGDDHIQKMARGRVSPESWTHGSSAQRSAWFREGFRTGTIDACDTFSLPDP